jgi:hypothetical protein
VYQPTEVDNTIGEKVTDKKIVFTGAAQLFKAMREKTNRRFKTKLLKVLTHKD